MFYKKSRHKAYQNHFSFDMNDKFDKVKSIDFPMIFSLKVGRGRAL